MSAVARRLLRASLAGAAVLALGALAPPAAGQAAKPAAKPAAKSAPRAAAPAGPAVGASATYRWTSALFETVPVLILQTQAGGQSTLGVAQEKVTPGPLLVTYSVVRANARSYTLQIVTQERPDGTPLSVTQVTIDRASGKTLRSLIRRPKGVVATPDSALRPFREARVPEGRPEDVTVPAGRFTAVRGRAQGAELWVSDQVPVLGLVKGVWNEGTLELVSAATTGATDHFKS
jgi:hypothetical protein